ncbi:ABC transporter permease [Methanosarcina mazei]|uniref:ABC transporter permease n=4 Tax=Methanosarcina mazei TaxID=2209 RepID=A0A0F8RRA3_METMZ|nr:ABC transporter permease [Methanosarcina mazei]AKB39369.1 ABC transporter, permease protein [Methanosarcina mazei WWM610]AKB66911.1 ABC transporter, permease protein [Methanosarcina mazei LYC]AKB70265.1 ABC transporter, permease protein [Methanosarcina mazei C16]KKF99817.1 ABC transporter permease [Methanosarcina mazei]KKG03084.1 ABC transporter permease [Methanosarcina mazei]
MLKLRQAIGISLGSIKSSKLRSGLTTLGIVIGIAAVVANISLGESFNVFFEEEISAQGSNFIIIYSQEPNLFYSNELQIIEKTPGISGVSPIKQQLGEVTYFSQKKNIDIAGVTGDYEDTANIVMESGSFISDQDTFSAAIGSEIANEKFDRSISARSSIDVTLRLEGGRTVTRTFKVKGVVESLNASFTGGGIDRDVTIFVPVSTINQMLEEDDFSAFFAMSDSLEDVEEVSDEVDERLARNFGVSSRDLDDEDAKPYSIFNQADVLEQINQLSDTLRNFLVAVALISLLVGSIGIMNIMLVTVTERTREIGIMKALGFSSTDILVLFIVESIILSLFGGLLGLIVGIGGAYAVTTALDLPFLYPHYIFEAGILVAVIVGVSAGVYPANKAAKLTPVDALRYE